MSTCFNSGGSTTYVIASQIVISDNYTIEHVSNGNITETVDSHLYFCLVDSINLVCWVNVSSLFYKHGHGNLTLVKLKPPFGRYIEGIQLQVIRNLGLEIH